MVLNPTCSRWLQSRIERQQRSTLAQKCDAAFLRHGFSKRRVQSNGRIHEPHAVGPDQTQTSVRRPAPQMFLNFFFKNGPIVSLFAEPRRNYDCRFHSRVNTLPNNLGHSLRRCYHQRQVDSSGNVSDVFVGFDAEHFAVAGIHGMNFDGELTSQQIGNDRPADGSGAIGGSDHSRRTRQEERIESRPRGRRCGVDFSDGRRHGGTGYFAQRISPANANTDIFS